jgi:hypothetical protein
MKRILIAAVAAALLAGCNGNNGYNYQQPTPGPACVPPANALLVYPSNNATGVPDATSSLYIAVPATLASASNLDLDIVGPPSYGSQLTSGFTQVAYGSIPTPNTVPTYSNPVYYKSNLSFSLTAASTFDVYWNNPNSNCTSGVPENLLGAFTTQ